MGPMAEAKKARRSDARRSAGWGRYVQGLFDDHGRESRAPERRRRDPGCRHPAQSERPAGSGRSSSSVRFLSLSPATFLIALLRDLDCIACATGGIYFSYVFRTVLSGLSCPCLLHVGF